MNAENPNQIRATGSIPAPRDKGKPITVIGTNSIRAGFDSTCLQQALNARSAPGVTDLVLNPDAHAGYGAPVGCVLTSSSHIYSDPVGVDIKCSMSFLELDLPVDQVADRTVRRALVDAILERTPKGPGRGQRSARKARKVGEALGAQGPQGRRSARRESGHGRRVAGGVARARDSAGVGGALRRRDSRRPRWNECRARASARMAARRPVFQLPRKYHPAWLVWRR